MSCCQLNALSVGQPIAADHEQGLNDLAGAVIDIRRKPDCCITKSLVFRSNKPIGSQRDNLIDYYADMQIAVIAKKGGVGKTTLCILLHEAIRQTGQRVAVRDFDAQGSATKALNLTTLL